MIKQLKDYIDIEDIITNGTNCITSLFSTLSTDDGYNEYLIEFLNTNNADLTLDYLGNRLNKILSPLYLRLIEHYDDDIAQANAKLINIIENRYLFNWNKLAQGFFADYNPIHNYDMTENEGIEINNKSKTENSVTQKYAGFNSVDSDELPKASESDGETETTGTAEFNNSDRELTRSGNIGVTTTAQMLTQEFELRKRTLLGKIYDDIDNLLFLDYYK